MKSSPRKKFTRKPGRISDILRIAGNSRSILRATHGAKQLAGKFGFSLNSGAAADAVQRVLAHPRLRLVGTECARYRLPVPHLVIEPGRAISSLSGR